MRNDNAVALIFEGGAINLLAFQSGDLARALLRDFHERDGARRLAVMGPLVRGQLFQDRFTLWKCLNYLACSI